MTTTKIEWTQKVWNPVRGCTRISSGCKNCYAERIAARFSGEGLAYKGLAKMTSSGPRWTNQIRLLPEKLFDPIRWKTPSTIFVNSMSDLFHKDVPFAFIQEIFDIIEKANWHTFQILTKRSERLLELNSHLFWPKNTWMGVTVENQDYIHRIDHLRQTNANIKFLSLEPLIGPLKDLKLDGIDWVIVGGESGPRARPMKEEWLFDIRDNCIASNTAFFFKQWGGINKKKNGKLLQGKIWNDIPSIA